jgi:hypothetical protein
MSAILDNWIKPIENKRIFEIAAAERQKLLGVKTHPGYVNQENLSKFLSPGQAAQLSDIAYQDKVLGQHFSLLSCQGISFHRDFLGLCALWIIHNDGYSVEGRNQVPSLQDKGAVLILDTNSSHRCKSVDRKIKGKYWIALCIDYRDDDIERINKELVEEDLNQLSSILT